MKVLPVFVSCLVLTGPAHAQDLCTGHFVDPDSDHPTRLDVLVSSPLDGSEIDTAVFAPDCGREITVQGIASTIGIPPRIDFYLVLDSSGSTGSSSGVDLDADGYPDTILQAELVAAEAFVDAVDLVNNRVALIDFNSSARTLTPLTQARNDLSQALADRRGRGPTGGTDYGAAMHQAVQEHDSSHDPTREQVILFLSDGAPGEWSTDPPLAGLTPCRLGSDREACSGIYWAEHVQRSRGIRVETFAVGQGARPDVLLEMANRGAGRSTVIERAGDVASVLPEVNLVGIAEVRVRSLDTLEEVVAELTPDGSFAATLDLLPGDNDLVITGVSDHDDGWTVDCERRVSVLCARYDCPAPELLECRDGGALLGSFRPWTSHEDIQVSSPRDLDGDGDAAGFYPLGVTEVDFLLVDAEGNQRSCRSTVEVRDTLPPDLLGVPTDLEFECGEPLPGPAAVTAQDSCEPELPVVFAETETVIDCPANRDLRRSWSARDGSGNSTAAEQRIRVRDTQPPVVVPGDGDLHCFRAANHWMIELGRDDFAPVVTDACSEVVDWVLVDCRSDQAEDDRGDGHTRSDCSVSDDGDRLLVRGERDGRAKGGRRYAVSVAAVDACGNWSAPAQIGHVLVLHDMRQGRHDCPRVSEAGLHH